MPYTDHTRMNISAELAAFVKQMIDKPDSKTDIELDCPSFKSASNNRWKIYCILAGWNLKGRYKVKIRKNEDNTATIIVYEAQL